MDTLTPLQIYKKAREERRAIAKAAKREAKTRKRAADEKNRQALQEMDNEYLAIIGGPQ